MQCPKCSYEPTLAETQRSPEDCVKCGISYVGYQAVKEKGSTAGHASRSKTSFVIGVALVLLVAIAYGGYRGYLHYERQQFIAASESFVRGTTVHLQQMIETQRNPGAMTFQELFNKSARSVEEIDGFVVKVSMLDGQQDIKDSVIDYMKSSQDVLRRVSSNWRGILELSSANDRIDRARARYVETTNEYASEYAKEAWDDAIEDSKEALGKVQEAKAAFNQSLARTRSSVDGLVWFSAESKPSPDLLKDI